MVRTRAEKVARIAQDIPDIVPEGDTQGDLLIVAWGSTSGPITAAMKTQRAKGRKIGHVHLRHLNPMPRNLGDVLKRYKKVLVPEMNMGQLVMLLRAKYLVDAVSYEKFRASRSSKSEIEVKIEELLGVLYERVQEKRIGSRIHFRFTRSKIFRPTRKFAGVRVAATTLFSRPCSRSSPSSA